MHDVEWWFKAAILACGGKLTIPDRCLLHARSMPISRFNDAHNKQVVWSLDLDTVEMATRADKPQQAKVSTVYCDDPGYQLRDR